MSSGVVGLKHQAQKKRPAKFSRSILGSVDKPGITTCAETRSLPMPMPMSVWNPRTAQNPHSGGRREARWQRSAHSAQCFAEWAPACEPDAVWPQPQEPPPGSWQQHPHEIGTAHWHGERPGCFAIPMRPHRRHRVVVRTEYWTAQWRQGVSQIPRQRRRQI